MDGEVDQSGENGVEELVAEKKGTVAPCPRRFRVCLFRMYGNFLIGMLLWRAL